MVNPEKPIIWVDADSIPQKAKSVILKAAKKNYVPVVYAANRNIPFTEESPLFTMRICENAPDAADNLILEGARTGDMVITRDIPLVAKILEKGICVINDRGTRFSSENIQKFLEQREESLFISALGIQPARPHKTYGDKELHAFSCCFDKALHELLD
ncbi:MAG: DUF188 domain-containing protein [Treponema sp.]|nr:DUF188 domain-containing protein [Treponema sp.]